MICSLKIGTVKQLKCFIRLITLCDYRYKIDGWLHICLFAPFTYVKTYQIN